jgi:hypothetical protein
MARGKRSRNVGRQRQLRLERLNGLEELNVAGSIEPSQPLTQWTNVVLSSLPSVRDIRLLSCAIDESSWSVLAQSKSLQSLSLGGIALDR